MCPDQNQHDIRNGLTKGEEAQSREGQSALYTLQKRLHLWQSTFDAMNEAITIMDRDFRILQCNRAMYRFLDRPATDILGRHCWEILHDSDRPIDGCPCPRVILSQRRETATLDIGSRTFKVDVDPQFSEDGKISRFVHIMSDITQQKRADDTIRETHQTLLTVLDSIDATIYVADMQSHEILFMNQRMRETFNGDFTGQKCWQAFYQYTDGPCTHCTNPKLIDAQGQPTGSCIWEGQNPINQRIYINFDRAIKWIDGRYVHLQVATDITDIKQMEEQRLRTEAQLRQAQKMEAIGTLASGIAHDFNNILSAILGYSELALDDALNAKSSPHYMRQILKAAYRARDLVQQILTFSRQTESKAKPIRIKPIVKEALKLLRASLPTTIDIQTRLDSEAIVRADPTQIHQVIMNLCTNAGHAMRSKGGVLSVTLKEVHLDRDFTRHYPGTLPGPHLQLQVEDTGSGIDPNMIDRIFDPYFTTKQKGEGTGMGLAMVQGIVQQSNGAISVESEMGHGTCFKIHLPIIDQEMDTISKLDVLIPGGKEHILFVDDEPALASLGRQILQRMGYQVTTFTSSTEALSNFKKDPMAFDLVITDMTMPRMTGDELARKIMDVRPDMPVVVCTGYSEKISDPMIEQLGIKALIMKPLVRSEMALAIRQALDERSPKGDLT
jgi:PAS domain S-box-containing protein